MIRVLAAVILASCATPLTVECTSRCGTKIVALEPEGYLPGVETGWTCEGLQGAEDAFLAVVADKYPDACSSLNVTLAFHPGDSWQFGPSQVYGVTVCAFHTVELSSQDLRVSAYAHEMLHVVQGCPLILPVDEGQDMAHGDWVRNGFNDMINQWRDSVW